MSFIDDLELVTEEVANWAVDILKVVTEAISPDGRPYGQAPQSDQEKIAMYLEVRGDSNKWAQWMDERTAEIVNRLLASNVPPEQIAEIKPVEIAQAFAIDYSNRMEALIREVSNGSNKGN